jgi:hypothetical protein
MSCTLGPITFDLLDDSHTIPFTIKRDSPNATGVLTSTGIPSLTLVSGFSVSVTFPTDSSPFPLHENVSNTIAIKLIFHYM